jgi:hypothetical protein
LKRARETYDLLKRWPSLSHERSKEARDLIVAWERMQLSADGLFLHLMHAVRDRANYEKFLAELTQQPGKREERRIARILEEARQLIELMRISGGPESGGSDKSLADEVELWVEEYAEARSRQTNKKRGRGRPGDPWLRWYVLHFAEQLRGVGQNWQQIKRLVYEAFWVIQMEDVVTKEKIWHRIRDARKKDREFGTHPARPCSLCGAPHVVGQALEMIRSEPGGSVRGIATES